MSDWTSGRWHSRDGLSLHYRDYGGPERADAPAVICLPGLLRNARDFDGLAVCLAMRFRVICPDFRGRGLSDRAADPATYVPGRYVRDLDALFDALDLSEAALIGTSLGGLVATVFTALRPERVTGVVLNDVGPDVDPAGLARIAGYVGKVPPVAGWDDAARAISILDEAVYPEFGPDQWHLLARQRYTEDGNGAVRLDHDVAGLAKAFALPETTPDTWPFFARLADTPLLVLRGAISDILARETVERMRALVPGLTAFEVPDRGHVPTLDEPEARAAIDAFLGNLPARTAIGRRAARRRAARRHAGWSFRRAMAEAGNTLAKLDD